MSMADKVRAAAAAVAAKQAALPDPAKAKRVAGGPPPPKPVVDAGFASAVTGMMDTEFIKTVKYGEQQFRAYSLGAHPVIIDFATLLVRRMRDKGIPMFPQCIWRDAIEQEKLRKQGFSKVSYPNSAHNRGCAVDIIHSTKAWNLTERQWQVVGHVGKELAASKGWKLEWGGDWKFYDPAHWQLANWRSHARVWPDKPGHKATL